ncbi:uncharacterized protein METZ01_LOCUS400433 [marine metagenome]|uniref:Uncharacterized protein n=1 Tax=marine metagenome TaxID=408172 RepID=A0A382VM21_9ZZZZ
MVFPEIVPAVGSTFHTSPAASHAV